MRPPSLRRNSVRNRSLSSMPSKDRYESRDWGRGSLELEFWKETYSLIWYGPRFLCVFLVFRFVSFLLLLLLLLLFAFLFAFVYWLLSCDFSFRLFPDWPCVGDVCGGHPRPAAVRVCRSCSAFGEHPGAVHWLGPHLTVLGPPQQVPRMTRLVCLFVCFFCLSVYLYVCLLVSLFVCLFVWCFSLFHICYFSFLWNNKLSILTCSRNSFARFSSTRSDPSTRSPTTLC
jgi:hypothetical protein